MYKWVVPSILIIMFVILFTSAWGDSATMDELAHIPSGYSYLSQKDFRLNPEHPPLIKDLSAIPLMFLNLNFPTDIKEWTEYLNGQWDMGRIFIYESGNNADTIIRWSRFPIMLLAILFGLMLFKWVKGLYGDKAALLTLFLFAFSPTFLAHSRYVTTDLAAAFGFFIGIAAFLNFLKNYGTEKEKKYLVIAGVAFGVAQLLKFSLVLLAPLIVIFGVLWIFLQEYTTGAIFDQKKFWKNEILMLLKIVLIGLIGVVVIWPVYAYHVWGEPVAKQVADAAHILESYRVRFLADFAVWLCGIPGVRALGQYFLGLLMVLQRAGGGNTTYFVGQITNSGWAYYFPLLYLLKEHLAFHLLTLFALFFATKNILKSQKKNLAGLATWMKENFVVVASFIFIGIYWLQAIMSPLNIGVRHVLPTFPFIYLIVARVVTRENFLTAKKRVIVLSLACVWMAGAIFLNFSHLLSYYNELAGGTANGYKIATDSNYDWGQDLKRLKKFTDENKIDKIAIDYFGGGNTQYYFGDSYVSWWSAKGPLTADPNNPKWFAISLTFLMGAHATPVDNFPQKPEDTYSWLKGVEPVARAGTSMFIYKF